uniref:Trans-1,2-dihydrobenzene-1,2-diol dehydrogenase n=1 Tax=Acanthochromis polyacanthus TaxID=80966 RepID=A0A3Q1FJ64_9TELE
MATRWGICSTGFIGHDFTVALKTLPSGEHQVVAMAARSLKDAQEFAKKHSISRAYGSYEELAKDPDVDVVYVGVIHPYHHGTYLLFTNAKKNVHLESNSETPSVVLLQAVWTRFFPASAEIRRLLAQKELGDLKLVVIEFGVPLMHLVRSLKKELGAGTIIDIGLYCLQFISMVYNGEKPESIKATAVWLINEIQFKEPDHMSLTCNINLYYTPVDSVRSKLWFWGVPETVWSPTSLDVNGKVTQYPLPEPGLPLSYMNGTGMCYEAEEVRQGLLKGLKESSVMSHSDSMLLAELKDEICRQVGVVYSQDSK